MTIIAWDGDLLVTDGRTTCGFRIITDEKVKIREFEHADLGFVRGAFCGAVMIIEPWIDFMVKKGFEKFEVPEDMEECGCSAILIDNDGKAYETDINGLYHRVIQPLAYGSGSTIAQHYLTTGADAVTAVRETIKTDASCGGRILAYDPKTQKYRSYAR